MPNYVEMLRLYEAGFSLRQITKLVSSGRNTVPTTVKIAKEKELSYEEIGMAILLDSRGVLVDSNWILKDSTGRTGGPEGA